MELEERVFTAEQREELAEKGLALPDGSYPIENKQDLRNAIQAFGRAKNPGAVKKHIIKRAKALGATDMMPEDWQESLEEANTLGTMMKMIAAGDKDDAIIAKMVSEGMDEAEAKTLLAKMKKSRQKMMESPDAIQIIEAVGDKAGREWDVVLIEEGLSENGRYYPAETLKAAVGLFQGVPSFADHAGDTDRGRPERSIRDKVGVFANPQYGQWQVGGRLIEGIKARFKVVAGWLREALLEAQEAGEPGFYGFSINASGKVDRRQNAGKWVEWVEAITEVTSVDVVTLPAAGGQIVRLVASKRTTIGENEMEESDIKRLMQEATQAAVEPLQAELKALKEVKLLPEDDLKKQLAELKEVQRKADQERKFERTLAETRLSEMGKARTRQRLTELTERRDATDEEITTIVKEAVGYEAALAPQHAPPVGPRIKTGDAPADKYVKALEGMFAGEDIDGVPRFRTIRESYCRWTGRDAFEVSPFEIHRELVRGRYDSAIDHRRLQESLTTADWTDIYGDVMYKRLIKTYREGPYNLWRQLCSEIIDVPDFMTQHWVRIGGYADLSAVAESGTYPQLTTPGDEEVEFAISKRGGQDDLTFEAIINDKVGTIRRIPVSMGRAASRTLFKFVMNLITTDNPTMDYDAAALYTGHGNAGTTALSLAGLNTTIIAMRDQTAYGESAEILGARNYPKFLIVPNELEMRAKRIVDPSDSYLAMILDSDAASADDGLGIDPQSFKGKGIIIVVYDQLTNAKDWWLVANPAEVPTVVMGFLNGQQEPELFVQDQPTVGSVYTADKISYKVRHIYGGDVIDHRSFYYQDVA